MLFDIENLFYAARNDPLLPSWTTNQLILLALGHSLETIAQAVGAVVWRVGAVAWIRNQLAGSEKGVWPSYREVRSCLLRKGYTILFTPGGKNAADYALTRAGLGFTLAAGSDTCILATGDGREPFPGFITEMLNRAVKVRVVAYDYAPENVRTRSDVSYALIGSDVRGLIEKPFEWKRPRTRISSRPRTLRENVRHYYETVRGGTQPPDIPSNHRMWIEQVIEALRSLTDTGTPWEMKFSEILTALKTYSQHWDPAPTPDELTVLLTEFLTRTDLFGKTVVYTPNWQSVLW